MKSNWIWVYIKYRLKGVWFFYALGVGGGDIFPMCEGEVVFFFESPTNIFWPPPTPVLKSHTLLITYS